MSPQCLNFHYFLNLHEKKVEYTQLMHSSRRNFNRRAHGLTLGGPWLEIFGLGAAPETILAFEAPCSY